jgi:hypothetical protein
MGIITSRPIVVALYLLVLFLWSAMFFYLVPLASGGWFGPTVSITFGIFSTAPMVYCGVWSAWRVLSGKPLVTEPEDHCPSCGQALPPDKQRRSAAQ